MKIIINIYKAVLMKYFAPICKEIISQFSFMNFDLIYSWQSSLLVDLKAYIYLPCYI